MYLESARFEQHDLVMLAETLEPWDALGKLYHLFDSRREALGERLPHFLTGAAGWGHRTCVQWTSLGMKRREGGGKEDLGRSYFEITVVHEPEPPV